MQEPKLTTFETSKTPLTLLVAFPKHSESEHRPKVMRCGHKPPEETALTGEAPALSCICTHVTHHLLPAALMCLWP